MSQDDVFDLSNIEDDAPESELLEQAEALSEISEEKFEKRIEDSRKFKEIPDEVYEEKDLVKRTRKLMRYGAFNFPNMKGSEDVSYPDRTSDNNRRHYLEVLFDNGSGRCPHPFADSFAAKVLDHKGEHITMNDCPCDYEIATAMESAGLKNQPHAKVATAYYAFARKVKRNSLTDRFQKMVGEWDGVERCESMLIKAFNLRDTPLNRLVLRYFWHSLYMRINEPGCDASLAITLIGDQDVGKSYFSTIICEELIGPGHTAVQLDFTALGRDPTRWLRKMTGHSVIANVGEMKGFNKAELESVKSFTAETSDKFDRKWEGEKDVKRQWILIGDANLYEGFHRDRTGNRRFFPFFINQIEDSEDGAPQWEKGNGWKGDLELIRASIWPIMSECHHNITKHGKKYYRELKANASRAASQFSEVEMANGHGTIDDSHDEATLHRVFLACALSSINGAKNKGAVLEVSELAARWDRMARGSRNPAAVRRIMESHGWAYEKVKVGGRAAWCFILHGIVEPRHAKLAWWRGLKTKDLPKFIDDINNGRLFDEELGAMDKEIARVQSPDTF